MNRYINQDYSNHTIKLKRQIAFEATREIVNTRTNGSLPPRADEDSGFGSLPDNHLFNEKNREMFLKFLPYLEKVAFTGNDSIYQPGDEIDFVYLPQSAVFSEFQILEDGSTVEIAMTGSEGIIGLAAIFDNAPANNWTQVSVAGSAFKIKSQILRKELRFDPNLQNFLFGCISSYINQISQRAVCNKYHTLEKRFCSWLLMLQDRLKNAKLPLTQEQIARILGAHRPTITNVAYSLRAAKIIDYRRGTIVISSRRELEKRACRCYAEIDKKMFLENFRLNYLPGARASARNGRAIGKQAD